MGTPDFIAFDNVTRGAVGGKRNVAAHVRFARFAPRRVTGVVSATERMLGIRPAVSPEGVSGMARMPASVGVALDLTQAVIYIDRKCRAAPDNLVGTWALPDRHEMTDPVPCGGSNEKSRCQSTKH